MKECENKKKKVLRDRPLTFCRMPEDENEMISRLHNSFEFEPITKKRATALLCIILCVVQNSKAGYKTSYSRKEGFYSGKSRAYGKAFTYTFIMGALDHVAHTGMLIDHRIKPGSHNSEQSTLEASPKLIQLCRKLKFVEVQKDLIYVKDLRDRFVTIPETKFSEQRRRDLEMINAYYEKDFRLSFDNKFKVGRDCYEIEGHRVDLHPVRVHCTFSRASWDAGGRLYSWTTNLPKTVRPHLLMNGSKCCELDFKTFHPSLLFALAGKQIDRDVYDHPGYDRELCKKAFQAALNGKNLYSSAFRLWEDSLKDYEMKRTEVQTMVQTIVERTPEIQEFFFDDFGVKLQSLESRMIVEIIKSCIGRGVPVLTVHDSIIVPECHEVFAHDTMKIVYSDFMAGFTCGVSRKW